MATTSWGLPLLTRDSVMNPIATPFNLVSNALNSALDKFAKTVATEDNLPSTGNWNGRHIWVDDQNCDFVWLASSSEWISTGTSYADITDFSDGWTPLNTSGHKPRLRRQGQQVFLYGGLHGGHNARLEDMFHIPEEFAPPNANTRFIGANINSVGYTYELYMEGTLVSTAPNYASGTNVEDAWYPIVGTWWRD